MNIIKLMSGMFLLVSWYAQTETCATCLARLRQQDKPFFMRYVSAQITTANEIRSKQDTKNSSESTNNGTPSKK